MKKKEENDKVNHGCECGNECDCQKNYNFDNKKHYFKIFVFTLVLLGSFAAGFLIGAISLSDVIHDDSNVKCSDCDKISEKQELEGTNCVYNEDIEIFSKDKYTYDDLALKDDKDIEHFINSFSYDYEESIRNDFFDNNGDDSVNLQIFKEAYVLNEMFGHMAEYMNPILIGESVIIDEIKKVFVVKDDFEIVNFTFLDLNANDVSLSCDSGICTVNVGRGGTGVGNPYSVTKIVSSIKSGGNTVYTLEDYYYISEALDDGADFVYTSSKVGTYEMTFDKDNRYVSSKKIN